MVNMNFIEKHVKLINIAKKVRFKKIKTKTILADWRKLKCQKKVFQNFPEVLQLFRFISDTNVMPKKVCSNGNRRPIRYENWNGPIAIPYDVNINYKYIYMAYTNSLLTSKWKFKLQKNFHNLQTFMFTSLDKHQVLVQQWHNGYQKLFKLGAHNGLTWVNFSGLVF